MGKWSWASLLVGALAGPAQAEPAVEVDAAIVTGIDLSSSISRHEEWLQVEGIARAIVHPAFLNAIRQGAVGRITFAVYSWASGEPRVLVSWQVIDGSRTAGAAAARLRRAPRTARFGGDADDDEAMPDGQRLTDLSSAIGFATRLFDASPTIPTRRVLNLIADGADNVGPGPAPTRDQALAAGITINGVVVGAAPDLVDYFRNRVIGGVGCFVLKVGEPAAFAEVMLRKFLMDLIAGVPAEGPPRPSG